MCTLLDFSSVLPQENESMCCSDTALQGLCPAHSLRLAMDSSIVAALEPGELPAATDALLANQLTFHRQTASLSSVLPFPFLLCVCLLQPSYVHTYHTGHIPPHVPPPPLFSSLYFSYLILFSFSPFVFSYLSSFALRPYKQDSNSHSYL